LITALCPAEMRHPWLPANPQLVVGMVARIHIRPIPTGANLNPRHSRLGILRFQIDLTAINAEHFWDFCLPDFSAISRHMQFNMAWPTLQPSAFTCHTMG